MARWRWDHSMVEVGPALTRACAMLSFMVRDTYRAWCAIYIAQPAARGARAFAAPRRGLTQLNPSRATLTLAWQVSPELGRQANRAARRAGFKRYVRQPPSPTVRRVRELQFHQEDRYQPVADCGLRNSEWRDDRSAELPTQHSQLTWTLNPKP